MIINTILVMQAWVFVHMALTIKGCFPTALLHLLSRHNSSHCTESSWATVLYFCNLRIQLVQRRHPKMCSNVMGWLLAVFILFSLVTKLSLQQHDVTHSRMYILQVMKGIWTYLSHSFFFALHCCLLYKKDNCWLNADAFSNFIP